MCRGSDLALIQLDGTALATRCSRAHVWHSWVRLAYTYDRRDRKHITSRTFRHALAKLLPIPIRQITASFAVCVLGLLHGSPSYFWTKCTQGARVHPRRLQTLASMREAIDRPPETTPSPRPHAPSARAHPPPFDAADVATSEPTAKREPTPTSCIPPRRPCLNPPPLPSHSPHHALNAPPRQHPPRHNTQTHLGRNVASPRAALARGAARQPRGSGGGGN